MTVANVVFEPNRIRLVTDTLSYRNKSPVGFGRKVHCLPSADGVLMVRGYRSLATEIQAMADDWENYPFAVGFLSRILAKMPARYVRSMGAEITLAGLWDGQPKVVRFGLFETSGDVAVTRHDLETGVYLAPSLGSHQIPAQMTTDQLLKVALLQQEIALRHGLNMCVGGDVELTTIEPGRKPETMKLGEYPNKNFIAKQIERLDVADIDMAAA